MNRLSWDNRVGRAVATYGADLGARGNGYLVPIIPKTDFLFDGKTGQSQTIPLAVGIDASAWVSGALIVRVHARATSWSSATLAVNVENILLVPEEPDVVFAASAAVASATNIQSLSAGGLSVVAFSAPIGPMLRVRIVQANSANENNSISIGVDLVGRPA